MLQCDLSFNISDYCTKYYIPRFINDISLNILHKQKEDQSTV